MSSIKIPMVKREKKNNKNKPKDNWVIEIINNLFKTKICQKLYIYDSCTRKLSSRWNQIENQNSEKLIEIQNSMEI